MSNQNDFIEVNVNDINTILNQVEEAHAAGRINNVQYSNIIKTFKDVLTLVINSNSSNVITQPTSEAPVEISGGFLSKLMSGGNSEFNEDISESTLDFNKDDTIDQDISLKGGYDYLYNSSKKNKFTPTASYHAKKSFDNGNNDFNKQIKQESESLTGGALNNYFNKLIESTLKNKKVKGGDFEEDEFDGGAKKRKACKKKKSMKGGEDEPSDSEEETKDTEKETDEKTDDEEKETNEETKETKETKDKEETDDKEKEPINIDNEIEDINDDNTTENDVHMNVESEEELDDILGGKSQLQPYHNKIVENITKYLDKYEPELEGEDKELKGKQIKRLLNVLYYKSDENTTMEDRIKQLEDIGDKTSTEAKLKKIITTNKDELNSIIDSWVKAEPKKKKNKKNKKPKTFDNTEKSIEIKNNIKEEKNNSENSTDNTETSIDGGIVNTASMIDSVIMGGKKKSTLKRNLFNY